MSVARLAQACPKCAKITNFQYFNYDLKAHSHVIGKNVNMWFFMCQFKDYHGKKHLSSFKVFPCAVFQKIKAKVLTTFLKWTWNFHQEIGKTLNLIFSKTTHGSCIKFSQLF